MGYPVLIAEDMPDIAADAMARSPSGISAGYTIAERPDLRVLRDPFSAKPHVLFYATKRVGGDVSDFAAIKLLKFGPVELTPALPRGAGAPFSKGAVPAGLCPAVPSVRQGGWAAARPSGRENRRASEARA